MKDTKITVLMPVYNAEKFLKEAINSILNQTFKDFEFLIIDDASTDRSKQIILSYKDPRIKYFENKSNIGVARTLNKGLRLAKGKYIARMDADDITDHKRLETEYKEIIKDRMLAVVASFYDIIDKNGAYLFTVKDASSAEEIYYTLQFRNCLGHSTVIFNKEIILNEFNGYRNYAAEDYDLWLRISKKYKIIKIKDKLHKLRISKSSRIGRLKDKINSDAIFVAKKNIHELINNKLNSKSIKILNGQFGVTCHLKEIENTLRILTKINSLIVRNSPVFLNKSIIEKECIKKRITISVYKLSYSKIGPLLKTLFSIYLFSKKGFRKFTQIINYQL